MPNVLPLKSHFYNWCNEYFMEPQMRVHDHQFLVLMVSCLSLHAPSSKSKVTSMAAQCIINNSGGTHKMGRSLARHRHQLISLVSTRSCFHIPNGADLLILHPAQCKWDHALSTFHATGIPLKVSLHAYCHDSFPMLSPSPLIIMLTASDVTSPTPLELTDPTSPNHDQSDP